MLCLPLLSYMSFTVSVAATALEECSFWRSEKEKITTTTITASIPAIVTALYHVPLAVVPHLMNQAVLIILP